MKRFIALILALTLCFSLVACSEPNNIVIDGTETTVTDFLIENLGAYIQSEDYLAREACFEEVMHSEAIPFTVTKVIEISAENFDSNQMSVHFLAVKADCDWATGVGDIYGNTLLVADYNTGKVYDAFMADESWLYKDGTMEQQIYYMLNGPLCGSGYKGGTIIAKGEKRTELSAGEITKINTALSDIRLALEACSREPDNIVVDGTETTATDFLIENLGTYVQSEDYLAREARFEEVTNSEAIPFTVTKVIEISAGNLGSNQLSVHFLAVKANCNWAKGEGDFYSNLLLVADYNTGKVYDEFIADESWLNKDGTMEQQIYYILRGPLCGSDYDGGTIIADGEHRTELSAEEISKINTALSD